MQIIVITVKEDAHIPYVQRHLSDKIFLFDTRIEPQHSRLNFVVVNSVLSVLYNNKVIKNPHSIWYRRPLPIDILQLPVTKNNLYYSYTALEMHNNSIYSLFPKALWVSNYFAIERAGYKPTQLETAVRLGFQIPDTLITNDSTAAKTFIKRHKKCVTKSLSRYNPISDDGMIMSFLTRRIILGKTDFSGLYLAPAIFQEEIDDVREIRVTVVDKKVFAAAITTKGINKNTSIRDYKMSYFNPTIKAIIEPYKLPKEISDKCVSLTRAFNLKFSAIDLLEDKNGKFWFLENNPNGQWAFVEDATGQQIGKAMAELLMSKYNL